MDILRKTALDPVSQEIWEMKYRFKPEDGSQPDLSIEDSWRRVARAVASVEAGADQGRWTDAFYGILKDYRFLPAGRILAGAGTGRQVTLFNCFVMGRIPDSLDGIFTQLKEAALTMQQGGGIGHDFSTLRPHGSPVRGVGADASGPISFMDVWDAMCRTIMSAGTRRGAMMGTMRCDHPDIEAFISAKQTSSRLRNFNLSVLVTDRFMAAVRAGEDWPLVFEGRTYQVVPAAKLWGQIMRSTYDYAEPGVIFIDRVNAENNLGYCESIFCTNPCGEQPLPPYGACLLGSVNLTRFVSQPFTAKATLDGDGLASVVATAVHFMDNVIDVSNYPLPQQREEAFAKRRIGLGVTGLADALAMCGLIYGTKEAAAAAGSWMALIERAAYLASVGLAQERGAFPLFDAKAYGVQGHASRLDPDVRDAILENGIRNGLLTSIAPTGTISLLAGNVSSGVEPIFSLRYERKLLQADGTHRIEKVTDFAASLWWEMHGDDAPLPEAVVTAETLTPEAHLVMQAALQRHVDSSISKTINVPVSISFEDFKTVYEKAFDLGLKGCTTFRPNAITGSVLSSGVGDGDPKAVLEDRLPMARDEALPGFSYKLKWPESDHAIYITINDIVQNGQRRPFEIFINSKNMEHYAWTVALTRMISAVFRRGGDVSFVVEELKAVFDPRGGQWMRGRYVPSLLAAIGGVIEKHMIEIGFLSPESSNASLASQDRGSRRSGCPRCGEQALVFQEGCATCLSCGYSKCS
ncbi:adenosylcobalamin-dependent ribonucleoside-diphosphate reductase [Aestuariivirga sp.]|uniref:adenosylcobalamin-dependent ribonucleoside-diphosphate reductase n=1 Tax=Aestuariivirga sp. TaxID=2650926 RepID=UPI00359363A6